MIKVFYESLGCIFVNHCTRVTHAKYRVKMRRKEKKNKIMQREREVEWGKEMICSMRITDLID